jgi:hypothetical protein
MIITEPGIYRGVTSADYFADPCPEPSLTQSLVKIMIERSPKHAWIAHPRLNDDWLPDDDPKFDVGNAAHRIVLGRGKDFEVLEFDDWRTKAAKDARSTAARAGKIGILDGQYAQACDMCGAASFQLEHHEDRDAFTNGSAEVMICWQEDGIWFRSLVDWLHDDLRTVDDYKSSGMSMAPHVIGLRAEAGGWDIQCAFIERGLAVIDPDGAGRRKFRFIGQETEKPHALTVMHMDQHWRTMGQKKVQRGVDLWRRCMETGKWPSYPARSVTPEYPGWKETKWLEREEQEFERVDSLMGG